MKLIVFTKFLKDKSVKELAGLLKSIDAQGADMCVRPGYPVEPKNARKNLPKAAKVFRDNGLSIPLITLPGEFTNYKNKFAESIFAACAYSGVGLIKLGYWFFKEKDYWKTVDNVRRSLDGFAKLAEKHSVKVCIHNHAWSTMGMNSCAAMNLVKGFDPRYVGIFADPGHLSLVGEPLPMALDIAREYICAIAAKDVVRERIIKDGRRQWQPRWIPIGEGYVDWHTLIKLLFKMKFTGPISIHGEYEEWDRESVVDLIRMDIRFIRKVMEETRKK